MFAHNERFSLSLDDFRIMRLYSSSIQLFPDPSNRTCLERSIDKACRPPE
jgi:hypothetical protein